MGFGFVAQSKNGGDLHFLLTPARPRPCCEIKVSAPSLCFAAFWPLPEHLLMHAAGKSCIPEPFFTDGRRKPLSQPSARHGNGGRPLTPGRPQDTLGSRPAQQAYRFDSPSPRHRPSPARENKVPSPLLCFCRVTKKPGDGSLPSPGSRDTQPASYSTRLPALVTGNVLRQVDRSDAGHRNFAGAVALARDINAPRSRSLTPRNQSRGVPTLFCGILRRSYPLERFSAPPDGARLGCGPPTCAGNVMGDEGAADGKR